MSEGRDSEGAISAELGRDWRHAESRDYIKRKTRVEQYKHTRQQTAPQYYLATEGLRRGCCAASKGEKDSGQLKQWCSPDEKEGEENG